LILYLDSSALVKLYVDEEGTELVRDAVVEAQIVGTCEIAYVELRAALARRHREGAITRALYRHVLRDIDVDWPHLFLVVVSSELVRHAADMAERHRLRAYDAIHLASGLTMQARAEEAVTFACWDQTLQKAAGAAKLKVLAQR
jgi:predicted nucleic acid-binding protein